MNLIKDIQRDLESTAFQVVLEYRSRLYADAVRLCGDSTEAEDLVMRTFDCAFRDAENFDAHKGEFYSWIKGILAHLYSRTKLRAVNRGTVPVDSKVMESYTDADWRTDEQLLKDSDSEALKAAMDRMDPEYKKVLVMHYFGELPVKNIALALNLPMGTVLWRLSIARKMLARDLSSKLGKKTIVALAFLLGLGTLWAAWQVGVGAWLGTDGRVGHRMDGVSVPMSVTTERIVNECSIKDGSRDVISSQKPQRESEMVKTVQAGALSLAVLGGGLVSSAATDGYAKEFTLTAKGYEGTETLTNFPVLVRLSEAKVPGFRYADFKSSGKDIRFALYDGTGLAYDCDTWNPSGESLFWVKIPFLTKGLQFKMFYGKAEDEGVDSAKETWSSYVGVWHENESGDGTRTVVDSTGNGISGTSSSASVSVPGMFGLARGMRATGKNGPAFQTSYNALLDGDTTAYSFSLWVKPNGNGDYAYLVSRKNADNTKAWGFQFRNNNMSTDYKLPQYYFGSTDDGTWKVTPTEGTSETIFTPNAWAKIDVTATTGMAYFYVNGILKGTYNHSTPDAKHRMQCGTLGLSFGGIIGTSTHGTFNGDTDECRYAPVARSADWIKAAYDAERPDAGFLGFTCETFDSSRRAMKKLYSHHRLYTVKGYDGTERLEDFPVLVRLSAESGFVYDDAAPDGGDLVFLGEDGQLLDHEVDTWNVVGESLVWIRLPVMTNGVRFCAWYGGAEQYAAHAGRVWKSYVGVWHENETPDGALTIADSTGNGLKGWSSANSVSVSGVFGRGRGVHQSGAKGPAFQTNYSPLLDGDRTAYSFSLWVKPNGNGDYAYLVTRRDVDNTPAWGFQFRSNNSSTDYKLPNYYFGSSSDGTWKVTPTEGVAETIFTPEAWAKIDVTATAGMAYFYVNGILKGTYNHSTPDERHRMQCGTKGVSFGGILNSYTHGTFNGDTDECRYAPVTRSADWIKATYDTENAPETFLKCTVDPKLGLIIVVY